MKPKHYLRILLPLCLAGAVLRCLTLLFAVEADTGYFVQNSPLPWILNCFLGACAVFFLTFLFVIRKENRSLQKRLYRFSGLDAVVGLLSAVFVLAGSFRSLLAQRLSQVSSGPLWKDLSLWIAVLSLVCSVFLVFFVSYPRRASRSTGWKICSLSLTVWFVVRLFRAFLDLEISMSRPYGIYYIVCLAMGTMAMLQFSKLLSGMLCRKSCFLFGMLFVLFQSIRLPDAILSLFPGNPYGVSISLLEFLGDTFLAIFFFRILQKMSKRLRRRPAAMADILPPTDKNSDSPAAPEEV